MPKRVLVVDDEKAILISYKRLLQSDNIMVDTADQMEDAEKLLKAWSYDVVIADLRLTGILGEEGLEILKYIKEHNLRTEVILVTGYGSPEIQEKARGLGAAFYFEKPVASDLLKDALHNLGVDA